MTGRPLPSRISLPVMLVLGSLLFPAGASAITLGPTSFAKDFGDAVAQDETFLNVGSQAVQTAAPFDGVITRFRVRGRGHMTLRVLRPGVGTYVFSGRAAGPSVVASPGGVNTFEARLAIQQGDYVGLDMDPPDGVMRSSGQPPGGWASFVWTPRLDATPRAANLNSGDLFNYNADVEPDSDGDGFGDESQDRCPGTAGSELGCAPGAPQSQVGPTQVVQTVTPGGGAEIAAAGTRLSKDRRRLTVPLRCPAGRSSRCSGRLSASTAAKVAVPGARRRRVLSLGGASFALASGAARNVVLTVPRTTRRAIAKLKRVRLRLTISAGLTTTV